MGHARLVGRIEHFEAHRLAMVDQARVAYQRLRTPADLGYLGEIAEIPRRDLFGRRLPVSELGELSPGRTAQVSPQLRKVASHGDLRAVLVDDAEVHRQMCGERLRAEGVERYIQVELAPRVLRDRVGE